MDHLVDPPFDPREYDVHELRESAEGPSPPARRSPEARRADDYRELLMLQGAGSSDLEKPYLDDLPGTYDGELTVFEWLEYLVEKGGFRATHDALRHYRSIGWITESVEHGLYDYLAGIPDPAPEETVPLDQSDHLRSLIFVGRLATQ